MEKWDISVNWNFIDFFVWEVIKETNQSYCFNYNSYDKHSTHVTYSISTTNVILCFEILRSLGNKSLLFSLGFININHGIQHLTETVSLSHRPNPSARHMTLSLIGSWAAINTTFPPRRETWLIVQLAATEITKTQANHRTKPHNIKTVYSAN